LVRITSPLGAVRRKIDQEKYSSVTGFGCAIAVDDHSASTHPTMATKLRIEFLCIVVASPGKRGKSSYAVDTVRWTGRLRQVPVSPGTLQTVLRAHPKPIRWPSPSSGLRGLQCPQISHQSVEITLAG